MIYEQKACTFVVKKKEVTYGRHNIETEDPNRAKSKRPKIVRFGKKDVRTTQFIFRVDLPLKNIFLSEKS